MFFQNLNFQKSLGLETVRKSVPRKAQTEPKFLSQLLTCSSKKVAIFHLCCFDYHVSRMTIPFSLAHP